MEEVQKARAPEVPVQASDFEGKRQPRWAVSAKPMRKRALLVEATPSSLRLVREILDRSGFLIHSAGSGIAGLTTAREHRPDLIIMDLQLPDVPGRELIGWVRDVPALRNTPVIVLAGASGDSTELNQLGPNTLLRRPVSAMMIHRAVREALVQK